jgi:CMP-N-acetylneuraminic acid synthetase
MINNRRVIAVVPARGGSKGVPGKNLRIVGGTSLLHRTLSVALASKYVDAVIASSDDDEILRHASMVDGVTALTRPADLASDTSAMAPVVEHVLHSHDADIVVLLQPTSPLRQTNDIDKGLEKFIAARASSLISVCPARTSPYWMYRIVDGDRIEPVLAKPEAATRQELPATFQVNGALYIVDVDWFTQHRIFVDDSTVAYVMPSERSIDVDSPEDLLVAEALLSGKDHLPASTDK